ncbi:hypothetical protein V8E54_014842 [Elaphomyces granulatus]|jgi:RING finger protein 113A
MADLVVDAPQFAFKKRASKAKSSFRKKAASPPPASDSDSDFESFDEETGHRIKRRRKNAAVTASSASNQIRKDEAPTDSTAAAPLLAMNDATKQSNWHEDDKEDNLSAKNLLGTTRARPDARSDTVPDGTYKGVANYQSFIQKNPNAPAKQVGPMKAPTNIRTITVTDYCPDVCKDYKQTGFCGFGDSCKFLHAREDYKQGWEIDREWEISTKGKKLAGQTVSSRGKDAKTAGDGDEDEYDDELLKSIPFACVICKKSYTNPIITKCGHYFCESCALQRYRKSPSCAVCGAGTSGVFNVAKKLNRLLDKKRERARKRREKAIAEGEEVNSDEAEEEPEDK